mmetsp:Transcript_6572/g.11735  ORF Transcript_6572/g.11735 Transcript_6572/m.11735 type:complete len:287 (+) Transcript_6572:127-987(+)
MMHLHTHRSESDQRSDIIISISQSSHDHPTLSSHCKHHRCRVLTVRFPQIAETSHLRPIHGTMVPTPGYGHDTCRFDFVRMVVDKSWESLYFTHCSNCNLRRKDHGRHVSPTNRTNITQSERGAAYICFREIPFRGQRIQSTQLHGNLQHAHILTALHHRHRQPPFGIHRHANIMPFMIRQRHLLHIYRRIQHGILHQRQARRLDEEGHVGQFRNSHLLGEGTECVTYFGQGVDVDFVGVYHVWYLEGRCHAFDHETVVSADGDYGIFLWRGDERRCPLFLSKRRR